MLHQDQKYEGIDRERLDYLDKEVSNYLEDLIDSPERHEMLTESDVVETKERDRVILNERNLQKQAMHIINHEENYYKVNELEILVANMKEEKE
jgi:hypothetical protein